MVVLRDVFELSVRETAACVGCSEAAVKMATSRGRRRLDGLAGAGPVPAADGPTKRLAERFAALLQARDLEGLLALIDDHAQARVLGCAEENGRDEIRRGSLRLALASEAIVRVSVESFRSRLVLACWYRSPEGPVVRDLLRLGVEGDRVSRLALYYFSPQVLEEVAGELQLPVATNGTAPDGPGWWNDRDAGEAH